MNYSDADLDRYLQGDLPIRTLGEVLNNVPADPPSLIPGLVVKGLIATLAGVPKVGKSTFMFGMTRAIRRGESFLGRPTTKAGVLLLTVERELTLREKRDVFGLGDDDMHVLMRWQAGNDWAGIVERVTNHCLRYGLELLVVDPWDKWVSFGFKEENDAGATLAKIEPLQMATSAGLAVLILSHQAKAGGIRGSNAFSGAVDVILELEQCGGSDRVLKGASRLRSTPERMFLEFDYWTGLYSEQLSSTLPRCPWD